MRRRLGKRAETGNWDDIRLNEMGKGGDWIQCEIWKPENSPGVNAEQVRSTTTWRSAEVVFDKVELVPGGELDGRVNFTGKEVRVRGQFRLHLEEAVFIR